MVMVAPSSGQPSHGLAIDFISQKVEEITFFFIS